MDHAHALPLLWRRFQHWWVTPAGHTRPEPDQPPLVAAEPVFMQGCVMASAAAERGVALIRAIDAGGVPLNPMRVNDIGRRLGLEVSTSAPMDETIERIRQQLLAQHRPAVPLPADTADA